jgi:hypothetical protein
MLGALKAEPALLVTPSSQQSEQDGGLLTAPESLASPSETALLKLDADIGSQSFRTPPLRLL